MPVPGRSQLTGLLSDPCALQSPRRAGLGGGAAGTPVREWGRVQGPGRAAGLSWPRKGPCRATCPKHQQPGFPGS